MKVRYSLDLCLDILAIKSWSAGRMTVKQKIRMHINRTEEQITGF